MIIQITDQVFRLLEPYNLDQKQVKKICDILIHGYYGVEEKQDDTSKPV